MQKGVRIGIVTAAGYTEAEKYYDRLYGLLNALAANDIPPHQLIVMGGEANFMFAYTPNVDCKLEHVPGEQWQLPEMRNWTEENVTALLDVAEGEFAPCACTCVASSQAGGRWLYTRSAISGATVGFSLKA